jgi:hypothetical protein
MTLTLRPTGLRQSAAFARLADYTVHEDGRAEPIGRIYEVHAPTRPELLGPGRSQCWARRVGTLRRKATRRRWKR